MIARSRGRLTFALCQVLRTCAALAAMGVADGSASTALAQGTPDSRVAVSVVAGFEATAPTFSQSITFEQYSEPGSLTTSYTRQRGPVADIGATVRVWRNFGVGVSGSHSHDSGTAQVHALVPHPFVFNHPREVNGPADVTAIESAVHVQAAYWAQLSPRLDIVVSGGPSFFHVEQDFVSDVAFTETDPYDTAAFQGATVERKQRSVTGGNIGGEVGWRLATHIGLAGAVRYSRATADFPDTSATPVRVGGLHLGGGVRLLF
jgi:hypothetical protein